MLFLRLLLLLLFVETKRTEAKQRNYYDDDIAQLECGSKVLPVASLKSFIERARAFSNLQLDPISVEASQVVEVVVVVATVVVLNLRS